MGRARCGPAGAADATILPEATLPACEIVQSLQNLRSIEPSLACDVGPPSPPFEAVLFGDGAWQPATYRISWSKRSSRRACAASTASSATASAASEGGHHNSVDLVAATTNLIDDDTNDTTNTAAIEVDSHCDCDCDHSQCINASNEDQDFVQHK